MEIDNNVVERSIRPLALTRKNALFAGSDGGGRTWATIATLIATARLNDVDPQAWLTTTLQLDYFEQMAAMEKRGAIDLELIELLIGRIMVERWEMWEPAIAAAHGPGVYPLFEELAGKMRR